MDFERAFVTGGSGLLGSTLVRKLVARGVQVTALVRSLERADGLLRGIPVNIVEGDLGNIPAFARCLAGNDVLFHTAACYRGGRGGCNDWEELYKTNVEGSEYLYKHAADAGIRRFVHASSTVVLQSAAHGPIDETMLRDDDESDDYVRSRILSDQVFMQFLNLHPDVRGCVVIGGWMFGPQDAAPTLAGQVVLDFAAGRLVGALPGFLPVVDARDVAQAMISAALRGRSRERYLVAGRTVSLAELFALLEQITGTRAPAQRLPAALLKGLSTLNGAIQRCSGRPVSARLARLRELAREAGRSVYVGERAERELGIVFRPLQDTLADVVDWYRQNGMVRCAALTAADTVPSA